MSKVFYYINKEKCIACGACIIIAKDLFEFDKDGKAINTKKILEDEDEINLVIEASKACPVNAIIFEKIE